MSIPEQVLDKLRELSPEKQKAVLKFVESLKENGMANAETNSAIDWMACELIEKVPGKVSGRPVVRGTRILPDVIVDSYDLGETLEELREGFPSLSVSQIQRLIEFAHAQRETPAKDNRGLV